MRIEVPPNMKRKINNMVKKPKRKQLEQDEVESGDDDLDMDEQLDRRDEPSGDEEIFESAHEKRFRLAKEYLNEIEKQEKDNAESQDVDHDAISHRLKADFLEKSGKLYRKIAEKLVMPNQETIKVLRGHKLSPTCVVVTKDCQTCLSGSKDGSIILWDIGTGKKLKVINGCQHLSNEKDSKKRGQIFCLAVSDDQKFVCSGGSDSLIRVWDFPSMKLIKEFTGHKGAVTGLTFRQNHHQLFSSGHDRSVKVWDLDEMGYVDTMFGHQDSISAIDSLSRERAITCGSRDRSIRIWKLVEESQLVFNAHLKCGSVDCLSLINEDHFVSGSDDGAISVWSVMKKKPTYVVENAHCLTEPAHEQCWVSSIRAAKFTDLVASGSREGVVKLWRCAENYKSLDLVFAIPVLGFINDLYFSSDCTMLICAVGQEHKSGRWWRIKEAKNSIVVIPLTCST